MLEGRTMLGPASRLRALLTLRRSSTAACVAFVVASPSLAFAQTSATGDAPLAPSPQAAPTTQPPISPAAQTPTTATPGAGAPSAAPSASARPAPAAAPSVAPSPTSSPRTTVLVSPSASGVVIPAVDPGADARDLAKQGGDRPDGDHPSDVFSEDWWGRTRPVLELHGYFRTRGELFHNFALGRHDVPSTALWAQPLDNTYTDKDGQEHAVRLCGSDPANLTNCSDKTQATANLRLRFNPELHISDNLRIMSQIDALDNLVLGSTPDTTGAYASSSFFSSTQTSAASTVTFKRAWAEYVSPVGQVRFGRMPDHWGLGMVHNSGDYLDADYQSTIDRIQFVTGLRSLDLQVGLSWDFVGSGPTTTSPPSALGVVDTYSGQAYNTANLTNVDQWSAYIAHRMAPELQRAALARGDVVLNTGLYAYYRKQLLDTPIPGESGSTSASVAATHDATTTANDNGLVRRGAQTFVPDVWVQLLWAKLRIEAEFAMSYGQIERLGPIEDTKIREYGVTTQTEYRAVEDKLRLQFGFGWASGDPWVEGLAPRGTTPQTRWGAGPISTFAFNPGYQVDLILFRHLLSRVEGAYYFRPSVEYDFLRSNNGQKFGGNATIVWSRASEFVQTPGNRRDLGLELDLSLYYQAKDGSLNDNPEKLGGFYAMLQYGVLFPMGGLDYLPGQKGQQVSNWDTTSAQTVRLFLGVAY